MNKLLKVFLAVFGGIEVVFSVAIPILVSLLWIGYSGMVGWSSNALLVAGVLASLFRAIKVGFMKNG